MKKVIGVRCDEEVPDDAVYLTTELVGTEPSYYRCHYFLVNVNVDKAVPEDPINHSVCTKCSCRN